MKKIKRAVLTIFVMAMMVLTATTQSVFAQGLRIWVPRSVEEIKSDLLNNTKNGVSSYTVKWGDTLYAIALATNISMEHLARINAIAHYALIDEGAIFYFNEDQTVLSVSNGETIDSFDTMSGERANISNEEQQKMQQTVQTQQTTFDETAVPVQHHETETTSVETQPVVEVPVASNSPMLYTLNRFMYLGVINWNGLKFTYYSQSVLPGGGLRIPGRHVNADGYVADADGYIVLASSAPLGTIIDTPFGYQGKVYDRGTYGNHYDVYIR